MQRHLNSGHRIGVASQLLHACPHVVAGVDHRIDPTIIKRPPLTTLTFMSVGGSADIRWNRLPTEVVGVSLQGPKIVPADVPVGFQGVKHRLEIIASRPVCNIPPEFVDDVGLPVSGNHSRVSGKGLSRGFLAA